MAVQNRRYINKMRQDAIRRSREMAEQASERADRDIPPDNTETDIPECEDEIKPQSPPPKQSVKNSLGSLITELIGNPIDSDKLLIAAILLMLMKEGGDKRLILALGYILI